MEDSTSEQLIERSRWVWIVVLVSLSGLLGLVGLGIHWGDRPGYEEGLILGPDRLELYGKDITWESFCSELKPYVESGRISLVVRTEPQTSAQLADKARTVAQGCGAKEVFVQPVESAVLGPGVLDLTKEADDTCNLHHKRMMPELVPIYYGLMLDDEDTMVRIRHSRSDFPNARTYCRGGCMIGKERQALVYVCRKCRAARRKFTLSRSNLGVRQ